MYCILSNGNGKFINYRKSMYLKKKTMDIIVNNSYGTILYHLPKVDL